MIDLQTEEWKEALALVRDASLQTQGTPAFETARAKAFNYMCHAQSKRILALAHLLQPGATMRTIDAALVPLERVDTRSRITDAEMGIRTTDTNREPDRVPLTIIADNIRSAFNAGGIFRTADFFGVEKLILTGYTPTPENPQVKKTALNADTTVPWEHIPDVRDAIDILRAKGYAIYALETADTAQDIAHYTPQYPCALILGNERFGIDPDVVASADTILEIPSHGTKNSLNVVSAFTAACAFFRAK